MFGKIKHRTHKWTFVNNFRDERKITKVYICKVCKVSKLTYLDSLTHSHLKTEYINGKEVTSKAPACITFEPMLF
jgi:hypothetical protein